jgi:hypothetical protein
VPDDPVKLSAVALGTSAPGQAGPPPSVSKNTIEEAREDARKSVALIIVAAFTCVLLLSLAVFFFRDKDTKPDDVLKIIQAVLAPITGIVGAVTGFYFSASQGHAQSTPQRPDPRQSAD